MLCQTNRRFALVSVLAGLLLLALAATRPAMASPNDDDPPLPAYAPHESTQQYLGELQNGTLRWVSVQEAYHNTTRSVAGIRIKLLMNPAQGADTQQCTTEGASIDVSCSKPTTTGLLSNRFSSTCLEELAGGCRAADVMTGDKRTHLQALATWASSFIRSAVRVKSVRDTININPAIVSQFSLSTSIATGTDLVVIVAARPVPRQDGALGGYAACMQVDHWGRCIVGVINVVPAVLEPHDSPSLGVIAYQRSIVLRQMLHLVAGQGLVPTSIFVTPTGHIATSGISAVVTVPEPYEKSATVIISPRVLQTARDHFNCPDLVGMPLEDDPLYKGTLWESRLMGPEVMSAGDGTGEPYLSDLTLAFLEDTGHYMVDYSQGGSLVADLQTAQQAAASALELEAVESGAAKRKYEAPTLLSASTRWGRALGCEFATGSAKAFPDNYQCIADKQGDIGCSFDHTHISACAVKSDWETASDKKFTCGFWNGIGMSCAANTNDACVGSSCGIPSMFQPYEDSSAARTASGSASASKRSTGGTSQAMDFVPTRLNLWSCNDAASMPGSMHFLGSSLDVNSAAGHIATVPGQSYGSNARCLQTSMINTTTHDSLTPISARRAAGCFQTNCFLPNFLQVGITLPSGKLAWYDCPPDGGDMFIPGMHGTVLCPAATSFCAQQQLSGVRYLGDSSTATTSTVWSSVFGILAALVAASFVCCFPPEAQVAAGSCHFPAEGFTAAPPAVAKTKSAASLHSSAAASGDRGGGGDNEGEGEGEGKSDEGSDVEQESKEAPKVSVHVSVSEPVVLADTETRNTHLQPLLQPPQPDPEKLKERMLPSQSERQMVPVALGAMNAWGEPELGDELENIKKHVPKTFWEASDRPSNLMQCSGSCALVTGLVFIITTSSAASVQNEATNPVMALSALICILGVLGIVAACGYCCDLLPGAGKRYLTCLLLSYFHCACVGCASLCYVLVAVLSCQGAVFTFFDGQWEKISDAFPDMNVDIVVSNNDATEHILGGGPPTPGSVVAETAAATRFVPGGSFLTVWIIVIVFIFLLFVCMNFAGLIAAICIIPRHVLVPSVLTVVGYLDMLHGLAWIALGVLGLIATPPWILQVLELVTLTPIIPVTWGGLSFLVGGLAVVGIFRKSKSQLSMARLGSILLLFMSVVWSVMLFVAAAQMESKVNDMTIGDISTLMDSLGLTSGASLQQLQETLATYCICLALIMLIFVVSFRVMQLPCFAYVEEAKKSWVTPPAVEEARIESARDSLFVARSRSKRWRDGSGRSRRDRFSDEDYEDAERGMSRSGSHRGSKSSFASSGGGGSRRNRSVVSAATDDGSEYSDYSDSGDDGSRSVVSRRSRVSHRSRASHRRRGSKGSMESYSSRVSGKGRRHGRKGRRKGRSRSRSRARRHHSHRSGEEEFSDEENYGDEGYGYGYGDEGAEAEEPQHKRGKGKKHKKSKKKKKKHKKSKRDRDGDGDFGMHPPTSQLEVIQSVNLSNFDNLDVDEPLELPNSPPTGATHAHGLRQPR